MDDVPVDAVAPWTIKAVPTETRNKVIVAARKEGLTVGQWLERRVNEWIEDGGPVRVNGADMVPVSRRHPESETRADMSDLKDLVQLARDLSPSPDDSLLRLAKTTVRKRLRLLD
jgi:hypothetical protein